MLYAKERRMKPAMCSDYLIQTRERRTTHESMHWLSYRLHQNQIQKSTISARSPLAIKTLQEHFERSLPIHLLQQQLSS